MSNNRGSKNAHDKDFETYRQIAPEGFSDESLRNLIKSKNNKSEEIVKAIENIWHDTPEKLAVGSEWVTTSKSSTKKPMPQPTRRAETGGRGSGRRSQPAGGRGNGESSRAEKSSNSNASSRPQKSISPVPVAATPITAAPVDVPVDVVAPVVAAVPSVPEVTTTSSPKASKPAWGSGPSFAAKLKTAEIEKAKAVADALEEEKKLAATTADSATAGSAMESSEASGKKSSTPRTRARKSRPSSRKSDEAVAPVSEGAEVADKEDALVAAMQDGLAVTEGSSLSALVEEPATAAPIESASLDVAPDFLKLDKWDSSAAGGVTDSAAAANSEMFQFGSFGSSFGTAASDVDNKSSATTWAASADTAVSVGQDSGVGSWSASDLPSANASSIGSLFSQKNALDGSAASGGAQRPPPGLEQNNQAAGNKQGSALRSAPGQQQTKFSKETAQQQQQQLLQMQQQSLLYGQQPLQQSYGQQQLPPGISAPASANRGGMPAAPASNLPYGAYSPTFDLTQPQFMHPQFNPAGSAALSLPGAAGASVPATGSASGASASTTGAQTNLQAQQQQYAPAAPFPFYGNPYYGHQPTFYYGQPQVPNFYGQQGGRGPYQDQGLYGGNPYANQGSLYPPQQQTGQQQQQGGHQQFGESSAAYGMGSSGAVGSNQQGVSKVTGGKGSATGSNTASVGSQPTAGLQPQDLGMGGNYGGYNPYNHQQQRGMDPQAWQYQQNQPTPWGGPMMNFPAPPAGAGLLPSHHQQQQQQGFTQTPQQQSSHLGMNLSGQQQQGQQQGQGVGGNNQRNGPPANATYGSTSSFVGNRNAGGTSGSSTAGGVSQGW